MSEETVSNVPEETKSTPDFEIFNSTAINSPVIPPMYEENRAINNIDALPFTSTPISKPSSSKRQESDTISFKRKEILPTLDTNSKKSVTEVYLIKIFGSQKFVLDYSHRRKSVKLKPSLDNVNNYKDSLAILEVKILCKEDELKNQLKKMELANLTDNESLSLLPALPNLKFDEILELLKYIKILKSSILT